MASRTRTKALPIAPESFYSAPGEKTLLNWFTYEVALNFEQAIGSTLDYYPRGKVLRKAEIAPLAIALAKRVKGEFLRVQSTPAEPVTLGWGKKKLKSKIPRGIQVRCRSLKISPQWIVDAAPTLKQHPVVDDLAVDLVDSLNGQLEECEFCESQCLTRPHAPCTMFDTGPFPPLAGDAEEGQMFSVPLPPALVNQLLEDFLSPPRRPRKSPLARAAKRNTPQQLPIEIPANDLGVIKSDISSVQSTPPAVFQLKVSLRDLKPPVWRRLLLLDTATFADLHAAIQDTFGWAGYHLHDFTITTRGPFRHTICIAGLPPDGSLDTFEDLGTSGDYREDQVRLREFLSLDTPRVTYTYDFGDNWDHLVVLEKVLPMDPSADYPSCIKEKGTCPPEDSGGPWGYMEDRDAGSYDEGGEFFDDEADLEPDPREMVGPTKKTTKTRKRGK